MSIECPSQAWDRYIAGEDAAADAAMAMEEEVLKEAGYPNIEDCGIWTKEFALDTLEEILSTVISVAYKKGYKQASTDRTDAKSEYEFEEEMRRVGKKYKVVPYLRIDDSAECEIEPMSYEEAVSEKDHFESMQPENVYKIEEIEEASPLPNDPADW